MKRRYSQDRLSIPVDGNLPSTAALLSASAAVKYGHCENSISRRYGLTIVLGNDPVYLDNLSRVVERRSYPLDLRFTRDSPQYLLERRPCNQLSLKEQDVESLSSVLGIANLSESTLKKKSLSDMEELFGYLHLFEKAIKISIAREDPLMTLELGRLAIKLLNNIDLVIPEDGPTADQTYLNRQLPQLIARGLLAHNSGAWDCVRALEAGKRPAVVTNPEC